MTSSLTDICYAPMLYLNHAEVYMCAEAQSDSLRLISETGISPSQIAELCQRWKVSELALFGSALHGELRPDSDLDILVTFAPNADWSLLDHLRMQDELGELFDRRVDLVSRRAIERSNNWLRRKAILESTEVIYGL